MALFWPCSVAVTADQKNSRPEEILTGRILSGRNQDFWKPALEQAVDLGVDSIDDRTQVFLLVHNVEVVDVDDEQLSLFVG